MPTSCRTVKKLIIDIARIIRVGFLQQNAYHKNDTYVPLKKQYLMMKTILHLYDRLTEVVNAGISVSEAAKTGIYEKLIKMKYDISNSDLSIFDEYNALIDKTVDEILFEEVSALIIEHIGLKRD